MLRAISKTALLALLLLSAQCSKSPPRLAITEAWMRPMLDHGAAFMIINNTGGRDDALLSADCADAKSVTLHRTEMDGEMMRMTPVDRLPIPGYTVTELAPTAAHLMLDGLDLKPKEASTIQLHLHFERSGDIEVAAEVRRL